MNQGILILSFLLFAGLVVGAPADDEKKVVVEKPFTVEDCGKPIEDSSDYSCRALKPRVKWSVEEQDCVDAFYGGCHATANNFLTKDDCLKVAKPICQIAKKVVL